MALGQRAAAAAFVSVHALVDGIRRAVDPRQWPLWPQRAWHESLHPDSTTITSGAPPCAGAPKWRRHRDDVYLDGPPVDVARVGASDRGLEIGDLGCETTRPASVEVSAEYENVALSFQFMSVVDGTAPLRQCAGARGGTWKLR